MPITSKTHARVLVEQLLNAAKDTSHVLDASEYYGIEELLTPLDIARKEYEDALNEDKKNYPVRSTFTFRTGVYQINPCGSQPQYAKIYEHIFTKMLNDTQKAIITKVADEYKTDKVRLKYLGLEK